MKIVVIGAKGGAGKSLVAANLAFSLSMEKQVTLLDCDAEDPVLHLLFSGACERHEVLSFLPELDHEICTRCHTCTSFCRSGALTPLGQEVLLQPELCCACGGCIVLCPQGSISEKPRLIGDLEMMRPFSTLCLIIARLRADPSFTSRVVAAAKESSRPSHVQIRDSPSRLSAGAIEAMKGADFCIIVTDATIFGRQCLEISAMLAAQMEIPAGVVITGGNGTGKEITHLCTSLGTPLLLELPFDREIARLQGRGRLCAAERPELRAAFVRLYREIEIMRGRG